MATVSCGRGNCLPRYMGGAWAVNMGRWAAGQLGIGQGRVTAGRLADDRVGLPLSKKQKGSHEMGNERADCGVQDEVQLPSREQPAT